jgi:hypothetical protein
MSATSIRLERSVQLALCPITRFVPDRSTKKCRGRFFRIPINTAIPNAQSPYDLLYPRSLPRSRGLDSAQLKTPRSPLAETSPRHLSAHAALRSRFCSSKSTNKPPHFPFKNSRLRIPRHHRTQPRMNLHRSRSRRDLRNIPRRNPTPRHNNDSPARSPHQLRNPRHRLRRSSRSPRSQHPRRSRRNHILQRRKQIRAVINRPVKRHRQRRSPTHQFLRPLDINIPIALQQPQHHAVHPRRSRHFNRCSHLLKLRRRINKIPATRPHHRKNRYIHTRPHRSHQLHTRRHSSHIERRTQLNPRRSPAFRRNRPLYTLDRNLHPSFAHHRLSLISDFCFPTSIFQFLSRFPHP